MEGSQEKEVEYRDIPGFIGYRVGDDGSVWTSWRVGRKASPVNGSWKKIKTKQMPKGHLTVQLRLNGKKVSRYVHVLVLIAFVGQRPEGMFCRHFPDRTPTNNKLTNLQWGTRSENVKDSIRDGTHFSPFYMNLKKLDSNQVKEIRDIHLGGESMRSIAMKYGVSATTIKVVVLKRSPYCV